MENIKYDIEQLKFQITGEGSLDFFRFGMICLCIDLIEIAIGIEKLFTKVKSLFWDAYALMLNLIIPFGLSQFFKENLWEYLGYLIIWLMFIFSKSDNYKTNGKQLFIALLGFASLFCYSSLLRTEQEIVTNILEYTLVGCSIYFALFFCKAINPIKKRKNPSYIFLYIKWRYRVINILLNVFKLVNKKIIGG
ncbi:hypothetical protein IB680_05660 [Francisella philomiragia]|uniref:hypothetical protein n=1 Tax=Francisella philomiragia TaxID=28110 RepID=UPI000B588386|nr:hypothetical protein [Francisella philomiragia]MBK2095160.1 hypothetical protein [Francisella philomiragia]